MNFIGRDDPARKLASWLRGEGPVQPLRIVSISGPGGVGKSFLFEHVSETANLSARNYLRLSVSGSSDPHSIGQTIGRDLVASCTQLDAAGTAYFKETRKNVDALRIMDDEAKAEMRAALAGKPELRDAALDLYRFGIGLQSLFPTLKKHVDLTKIHESHLDAAIGMLEKSKAYAQESRALGGLLPDLQGKGRRNRLRADLEGALAEGLMSDLSSILSKWRNKDAAKPMPTKVAGLDRLLLVFDDYESLAERLGTFLGDHLVPLLAQASFETVMVVIGRDRLTDTHPVWRQRHDGRILGEIRLESFEPSEAEAFVRARGISDDETVARLLRDTAGYPYLLTSEVDAELAGGRNALGLKSFFDRTARWMSETERSWLLPLCFLDEINEETIAAVLPDANAQQVLRWFKSEASVRSPASRHWSVLPILRSRLTAYVQLDSPKRFRELSEMAARARERHDATGSVS